MAQRRFLIRQRIQHPDSVPLMIVAGNICAMSGSQKMALAQYFLAHQHIPDDPFLNFTIGELPVVLLVGAQFLTTTDYRSQGCPI